MEDKAANVHYNPLFSPTFRAQVKCWDVHAEATELNKNTPKNLEKNASSMEGEMNFNSNLPQSSGKAKDSNSGGGKHCRHQSIMEDDKEWEGLDDLRMKVRRFMEEQEEENKEIYGTEEGSIMSYSASPLIIQAGGVASYHPLYSPYAPRPRFLRYGGSSPEVSIHKRRPVQSNVDIQISEEEAKTEAEADQGCNGEKSEAVEASMNESHGPQSAQDPPSLEDPRCENTTEDAEQPQESAEPDDTKELNPNSLPPHNIITRNAVFKSSRPVIRKMVLPLFMFLVLATASSGFGLLDNNYLGARTVQCDSAHMKPLSLTERLSLSQKMKEFFFLLRGPALHFEYMGRLKNSSSVFVGKFVESFSFCSCSSFSYLTSYKGWITGENCAKLINTSRWLMGNLMSFYQDMLVSTRSAAGEIKRFCKCSKLNQTAEPMNISCPMDSGMSKAATVDTDQASKDENQTIRGNTSTVHFSLIQEPNISTIDVKNYVCPEPHDQIVAEDEDNSTFYEKNVSQGSRSPSPKVNKTQRVLLNPKPLVLPVRQETFNTTSQGLTVNLGLDHKSPGIKWKRVTVVATVVAILLILVAGANFYLGWRKAQEMEVTKQYTRNKTRQRRQHTDLSVTPPTLGSFVQYVDSANSRESTPTAVRRSVRIRNRSLSPLTAPPTFSSPNSAHSFL